MTRSLLTYAALAAAGVFLRLAEWLAAPGLVERRRAAQRRWQKVRKPDA